MSLWDTLFLFGVPRRLLSCGGFRSQWASNELYDAYRRENGYFGELMNWIGVIEQILGGKVVVYC
ncbi:hypothetical protein LOZ80_05420 [Paenibacillus sp. HWE-109]|uniref:hypothetical protein n=1 Tax=Paenibacillus sp. HWE-109 TaxID=1306526 RepID=UPI001EE062A0|nr:hypothetical protein [Paenibacillus sp. HWE-109]UKS28377.1 hypothetical protein LOZ80_05420 [Paenibacillus sp. HWE-109]